MRGPLQTIAALALLVSPTVAAAAAPRTFQELAYLIVMFLDNATAVLIVLGVVIYFYGISTNILKFGNKGMELVRSYFFWGIIVLFLMVSIWGVLRLLQETIFGNSGYVPSSSSSTSAPSPGTVSPPRFTP